MSVTIYEATMSFESLTAQQRATLFGKKTMANNMINTFKIGEYEIIAPTTSKPDYLCVKQTENKAKQVTAKLQTAERMKAKLAKRQAQKQTQ